MQMMTKKKMVVMVMMVIMMTVMITMLYHEWNLDMNVCSHSQLWGDSKTWTVLERQEQGL